MFCAVSAQISRTPAEAIGSSVLAYENAAFSNAIGGGVKTLFADRTGSPSAPRGAGLPTALIVLMENTGDVSSVFPESLLSTLPAPVRTAVERAVDFCAEGYSKFHAALSSTIGGHYDKIVFLQHTDATFSKLESSLIGQAERGMQIDMLSIGHGVLNELAGYKENITEMQIRSLRTTYGSMLPIRMVYMINCEGYSLTQAWMYIGAVAAAGANGSNWMPVPMTEIFWAEWNSGRTLDDCLAISYNAAATFWRPFLPEPQIRQSRVLVGRGGDGSITVRANSIVLP